jgi:hypothetical protein
LICDETLARQSTFVVSVNVKKYKNLHKGCYPKKTADRPVSAKLEIMLKNFPKGLFQREADK